jgi:hypothetical protein
MTGTNAKENVVLATSCMEKSPRGKDRPFILIITQSRIILSPVPDVFARNETRPMAKGEKLPPHATGSFRDRWLKEHPGPVNDSVAALVREYRTREPQEILLEEKNAREIPFSGISDVTIRRVRDNLKNSRLRSFFLLPYPFEPASARYAVDYELVIRASTGTSTLLTPFQLELKQALVEHLGDRVHETIDSTAPLL